MEKGTGAAMVMSCATCILWSTGFDEYNGPGYCYSERGFTDPDYHCPFWEKSLRDEPIKQAPFLSPDDLLVQRVAALDVDVED